MGEIEQREKDQITFLKARVGRPSNGYNQVVYDHSTAVINNMIESIFSRKTKKDLAKAAAAAAATAEAAVAEAVTKPGSPDLNSQQAAENDLENDMKDLEWKLLIFAKKIFL